MNSWLRLNIPTFDKDYDFYYVTTSDKYIKGGATFLDIDDIKISALQFESGKSFWGYAS